MGIVSLGAIIALGGPKRSSEARQVVASGPGKQTLRANLVALRGEIALMEVEHEAEREILKQKIMRVLIVEQQLRESSIDVTKLEGFTMEQLDDEMLSNLGNLARKLVSGGQTADNLIRELQAAKKTLNIVDVRRAFKTFFEEAQVAAKFEIEKELGPLRKEYARHASELASKRIDQDDAERQYRGSR